MEIKIRVDIEEENESPYDLLDARLAGEVHRRWRDGNSWAWCAVIVTATLVHENVLFTGTASLGGCSYKDEADFKKGGYYEDMKKEAIEALWKDVKETGQRGLTAIGLLALRSQGHQPTIKEE